VTVATASGICRTHAIHYTTLRAGTTPFILITPHSPIFAHGTNMTGIYTATSLGTMEAKKCGSAIPLSRGRVTYSEGCIALLESYQMLTWL